MNLVLDRTLELLHLPDLPRVQGFVYACSREGYADFRLRHAEQNGTLPEVLSLALIGARAGDDSKRGSGGQAFCGREGKEFASYACRIAHKGRGGERVAIFSCWTMPLTCGVGHFCPPVL